MTTGTMRVLLRTPLGEIVIAAAVVLPFAESLFISCPSCNGVKEINDGFGWQVTDTGQVRSESNCRDCRATSPSETLVRA